MIQAKSPFSIDFRECSILFKFVTEFIIPEFTSGKL